MDFAEARLMAPAAPACFSDQDQWVAYLLAAQLGSKSATKPFFEGAYRPNFNYCRDCRKEHADAMAARDKCNPSLHRTVSKLVRHRS